MSKVGTIATANQNVPDIAFHVCDQVTKSQGIRTTGLLGCRVEKNLGLCKIWVHAFEESVSVSVDLEDSVCCQGQVDSFVLFGGGGGLLVSDDAQRRRRCCVPLLEASFLEGFVNQRTLLGL